MVGAFLYSFPNAFVMISIVVTENKIVVYRAIIIIVAECISLQIVLLTSSILLVREEVQERGADPQKSQPWFQVK